MNHLLGEGPLRLVRDAEGVSRVMTRHHGRIDQKMLCDEILTGGHPAKKLDASQVDGRPGPVLLKELGPRMASPLREFPLCPRKDGRFTGQGGRMGEALDSDGDQRFSGRGDGPQTDESSCKSRRKE